MTLPLSEKISYFVRASFYESDDSDNVVSDKKIRVASLVLECPPLRCWEDVDQYIRPELKNICKEENPVIDIELITPVSWPQQSDMVLGSPGQGKTGMGLSLSSLSKINKTS
ncbi:hypothetical protein [Neisseria sp. 83E34]|uniref:hypothetical protein n=1 Tax=Neisseria sp. 83E34 TaxID=1692264 RepID=UPI0006CE8BEB|nr:hypothetical protein [Neisseria sp. 83E34]KPN72617.1 hypothetical protein AKG09_01945 [Neisseria sp. 83E34]